MKVICTLKNNPSPHIHDRATEFPQRIAFNQRKFIKFAKELAIARTGKLDSWQSLATGIAFTRHFREALRRAMWKVTLENCLALVACLGCAAADEVAWLKIAAEPSAWSDASITANSQRVAFVLDSPAQTQLRGFVLAAPLARAVTELEMRGQVADFFKILPRQDEVELKIDWLNLEGGVAGFTRAFCPTDGRIRSVHKLGNTTITRTVIAARADDAIFIHLIADQPGALAFRVTLGGAAAADARIEDRRQLILPAGKGRLAAHVWVLPFESDVASEGHSISVRGEGEALIVWDDAVGKPLAATLSQLGTRYDPGHSPPDPAKIWHGVLANHLKSAENSP